MSEEIKEIPLDSDSNSENNQNIEQDIPEKIEDIEPEPDNQPEPEPPIKAKAKGRPKGATNKAPSKPRAKKVQVVSLDEAPNPAEPLPYEPSSPQRNLRLPTQPDSELAAAMLRLLQDQATSRQSRRQRLYSSWFQ